MALIVITILDGKDGDADVGVLCEPAFDPALGAVPTAAQACAMTMLAALEAEPAVKEKGRIALIN